MLIDILLLSIGNFISVMGNGIFYVSAMWWVYNLSNSPLAMSIISVMDIIPVIILAPFAGVVVDRFNKKNLMILNSMLLGIVALIVYLIVLKGFVNIYILYIGVLIISVISVFNYPCFNSLIPHILKQEDLGKGNSIFRVFQSLGNVLGPAAGGILLAVIGFKINILLDSISFFILGMFILFLRYKEEKVKSEQKLNFFNDFLEGFKYIRNEKVLVLIMTLGMLLNILTVPVFVLLPPFVKTILHEGSKMYGFLNSSRALGAILGGLIFGFIASKFKIKLFKLMLYAVLTSAVFLLLFGLSTNYIIAFIALLMFGILESVADTSFMTYMQKIVPGEFMGRVFGFLGSIFSVLNPIGYAIGGVSATFFRVDYILAGISIILFIVSAYYLKFKSSVMQEHEAG